MFFFFFLFQMLLAKSNKLNTCTYCCWCFLFFFNKPHSSRRRPKQPDCVSYFVLSSLVWTKWQHKNVPFEFRSDARKKKEGKKKYNRQQQQKRHIAVLKAVAFVLLFVSFKVCVWLVGGRTWDTVPDISGNDFAVGLLSDKDPMVRPFLIDLCIYFPRTSLRLQPFWYLRVRDRRTWKECKHPSRPPGR